MTQSMLASGSVFYFTQKRWWTTKHEVHHLSMVSEFHFPKQFDWNSDSKLTTGQLLREEIRRIVSLYDDRLIVLAIDRWAVLPLAPVRVRDHLHSVDLHSASFVSGP